MGVMLEEADELPGMGKHIRNPVQPFASRRVESDPHSSLFSQLAKKKFFPDSLLSL
jgi:hypothetical protein